jgi:hypothetical protein
MISQKIHTSKRDSLIAAKKIAHKVLLFGKKVFDDLKDNDFSHENAIIELIPFPSGYSSLERLSNYTLVILDYSAFTDGDSVYSQAQEVFAKLMLEALDAGTTFCFVHYNELVPKYAPYTPDLSQMNTDDIKKCLLMQIAFKWLYSFSIRPVCVEQPVLSGELLRNEFKAFLDKWGASHNVFQPFGEGKFDDKITSLNDDIAPAFTLMARKGLIVLLPFQRDFSRKQDLRDGLHSLIDCLLTYITRTIVQTPIWGLEPFFQEETIIRGECEQLEKAQTEAFARLRPFEEAKGLLFQSEYTLESTVPKFIDSHLKITTERDEKYKEDFWLLNDKYEKVVIGEVKSIVKGFKKSSIYSLYNHREENKLNGTFPALLIANCNLQAGSWNDKERPIDKQDYEVAAQDNILILRVEDLVRLWEIIRNGKLKSEQILALFTSKRGWLQVNCSLDIHVFE